VGASKPTVGMITLVSSLRMVPVPNTVCKVAFTGFANCTVNPSLPSLMSSPMTATTIFFCVSPAGMVMDWLLAAVKSSPALAVPSLMDQVRVTSLAAFLSSDTWNSKLVVLLLPSNKVTSLMDSCGGGSLLVPPGAAAAFAAPGGTEGHGQGTQEHHYWDHIHRSFIHDDCFCLLIGFLILL
jgi:hypothetical protein